MNRTENAEYAEDCLAGALMLDPACMDRLPPALSPKDFLRAGPRTVFMAAQDLKAQRKAIDPVSILHWAEAHGEPLSREYVLGAMEVTPTAVNADEYGRRVYESSMHRELVAICDLVREESTATVGEKAVGVRYLIDDILNRLDYQPLTRPASSYAYEEPRWVIAPYFQRGKGTQIQADPGVGKTAFMCAIAAAVTTGEGFLGLKVEAPGDVVMLSAEDSPGQLRGRLEASGADLTKVHMMENPYNYSFSSPEIEQVIVENKAKMIIFDPFQAFLGPKVDFHRANETRPILARLFSICEAHDCACVMISHLGKNTMGKSYVNQSLGSVDIPGAMRSILHIVRHPELDGQLMACHVKSSSAARGKTIAYSIGKRGGVNWLELTDDRIEDLVSSQSRNRNTITLEDNPLTHLIRHMIQERPQGGFWAYEDMKKLSIQKLGYPLFQQGKQLVAQLNQSYLDELWQKDGIQLETGCQSHGRRGIRLVNARLAPPPEAPTAKPDEYQEMIALLNQRDREAD